MTIDCILFDWDNTLIDSWRGIHQAYNATFQHFGMESMTLAEVQVAARCSARDEFPKLFGAQRAEEAMSVYREQYRALSGDPSPLEGAENLLKMLKKQSIPAGVISNKSHDFLERELTSLAWQSYFPLGWLGAAKAACDKPDPLILGEFYKVASGRTMTRGGMRSQSLGHRIYVGDNAIDIIFAQACSTHATGIGTSKMLSVLIGNNLKADEPQPDIQYPNLPAFMHDLSQNSLYA